MYTLSGPYLVQTSADGCLPQLDIVVCFDISSSMDDWTDVSLVNRYQKPGASLGSYVDAYALPTVTSVNGQNCVQGPLYFAVGGTNEVGLTDNATAPMDLNTTGGTYSVNGSGQGQSSNSQGLYAFNTTGHGTHPYSIAPSTLAACNAVNSGYSYTDLVVNLDGTLQETNGITISGKAFPADSAPNHYGLGTLVEAARGNLESSATASSAGVQYATMGVTPGAGWYQAYWQSVFSCTSSWPDANCVVPLRHPLGDAIMAAQNFFSIIVNNADAHFGLVTFSTSAGAMNSPSDASHSGAPFYMGNFSALCSGGPATTPYPTEPITPINPAIYLTTTLSQYDPTVPPGAASVNGVLFSTLSLYPGYGVMAEGQTNIADALDTALAMQLGSHPGDATSTPNGRAAQNLSRARSTRAIFLITDGLPNEDSDNGTNDPTTQTEASFAKSYNIPIYTMGLAMVGMPTSLTTDEATVLGDASTGSTSGVAYLSGGSFYPTAGLTSVSAGFQHLARQLVQLVR